MSKELPQTRPGEMAYRILDAIERCGQAMEGPVSPLYRSRRLELPGDCRATCEGPMSANPMVFMSAMTP